MVVVTEFVIAKIVLAYLSRQQLSDTYYCFLKESQNFCLNFINKNDKILSHFDDLELLPCLEDILTEYFATIEVQESTKNKDNKAYLLWKQLDVIISQLRAVTLNPEKARAFLRARKPKNVINIRDWKSENKLVNREKKQEKDQGIQSEEIIDQLPGYENQTYNQNLNLQRKDTQINKNNGQTNFPIPDERTAHNQCESHHHEVDTLSAVFTPHTNLKYDLTQMTPTKELLKREAVTKDFKSPKRKSHHPKRRLNTTIDLSTLVKLPENSPLKPTTNSTNENTVSPLLGTDDFSQLVKAMFANLNFQEKLADNINRVASGEGKPSQPNLEETKKDQLNVEEVVKLTSDELDLSELFSMLGDLNHEHDDTKKQLFFPASVAKAEHQPDDKENTTEYIEHINPNETDKHQTTEMNNQYSDKSLSLINSTLNNFVPAVSGTFISACTTQNIPSTLPSDSVCREPQSLLSSSCNTMLEPMSCIITAPLTTAVSTSNILQTCVRNLNTDLMDDDDSSTINIPAPYSLECTQNIPSETTRLKEVSPLNSPTHTDFQLVVYESQESYHDVEPSPSCVEVKTPSKISYIAKEKQPSNSPKHLHDSESIATDALLLLSTSPAKPEYVTQSQFSFMKFLTEPLSLSTMNFNQPPSSMEPLSGQKVVQQTKSSNNNIEPSPQATLEETTKVVSPQKVYFEKPHDFGKNILPKILPRIKLQVKPPPQICKSSLMMVASPNKMQSDKNLHGDLKNVFSQLELNSTNVKKQQNQRKRKSRERKKQQKQDNLCSPKSKEFVVRNLTFGTPDESPLLTEARNIVYPYAVNQTSISSPIRSPQQASVDIVQCEFGSPASILALKLNNTEASSKTENTASDESNVDNTSETSKITTPQHQPDTPSTITHGLKSEKLELECKTFTTIRIHNGSLEPSPLKESLPTVAEELTVSQDDTIYKSPLKTDGKVKCSIEDSLSVESTKKQPPTKIVESSSKEATVVESSNKYEPNSTGVTKSNIHKLISPRSSCLKKNIPRKSSPSKKKMNSTAKTMKVKFSFPTKSPKCKEKTSGHNVTINPKEFQVSQFIVPFKNLTIPVKSLTPQEIDRLIPTKTEGTYNKNLLEPELLLSDNETQELPESELLNHESNPDLVSVKASNKISFLVDHQLDENTSNAFERIQNLLIDLKEQSIEISTTQGKNYTSRVTDEIDSTFEKGFNKQAIEIVAAQRKNDLSEVTGKIDNVLENDTEKNCTGCPKKSESAPLSNEPSTFTRKGFPFTLLTTKSKCNSVQGSPSMEVNKKESVISNVEEWEVAHPVNSDLGVSCFKSDESTGATSDEKSNLVKNETACENSNEFFEAKNPEIVNCDVVNGVKNGHQNGSPSMSVVIGAESIQQNGHCSKKRKLGDKSENEKRKKKRKTMEKLKKIDVKEFLSKLHKT